MSYPIVPQVDSATKLFPQPTMDALKVSLGSLQAVYLDPLTPNVLIIGIGVAPTASDGSPFVTRNPSAAVATTGSTVTFTTAADGNPDPTVQWQSNSGTGWINIAGATSLNLVLANVQIDANLTQYRAIFTNSHGQAATKSASLSVSQGPVPVQITLDPMAQTVNVGATATFTAAATGVPTPIVQWQANDGSGWADIFGAVSLTLTIPDTDVYVSGTLIRARFLNSSGTVYSAQVELNLTVVPVLPTFTGRPSNIFRSIGQQGSFMFSMAGIPTPTVQWSVSKDDALTWSPIPGATLVIYYFTVAAGMNGWLFRPTISNSGGTIDGGYGKLTIV